MNQYLLFVASLRRMWRFRYQSLLMMLGLMVGVFTLTSGMALGVGVKAALLDYFSKVFLPNSLTLAVRADVAGAHELTEADIRAVLDAAPGISAWSPQLRGGSQTVVRSGRNQTANVMGVGAAGAQVTGQEAVSGRYFTDAEINERTRVVLVGQTVVKKLFGEEAAVGQLLTLGSDVFTIVGTLKPLGGDPHGGDLDNLVVLPYTTLMQQKKIESLGSVRFRFVDAAAVATGATTVSGLMRSRHAIVGGQQDDFYVSTAPAGQQSFMQFAEMFKIVLPAVVGIILLISSLVIASLLLISVKARTAEIGLRKAVGAHTRDIERQFLLEALLMALVAGALGIALSYPLLFWGQSFYRAFGNSATFLPTPVMLVVSMASAVLTGLLAAWWPARKAAALAPVAALR